MSFLRYPAYKHSGVEWLGEVPSHWIVSGTGHRLRSPPCYGVLVPDIDPDGVPMLKIMDLASGVPDRSALATISEKLSNEFQRTIVRQGDIVLSVVGTIGTVLVVPESLDGVNLSRALARLLPRKDLLPQWLVWVFSSENFTRFVDMICVGSAQRVLNMDDLRSFRAPFPPREEQTAIATFLDHETAKIDALVAEQERLIELLKEKRQAVISHAVTKGLAPSVPMKDSGVEWLGEVPSHWEVSTLKRHWTVTDCKHVTAEFVEEGFPLASIREVQGRWVELDEAKLTTEYFYQLLIEGERAPQPGDLIFSRNATVGEVAQVHADHPPFAMGQDVVLMRRAEQAASPDFLQLVLRSSVVVQQLALCMIGSTFKRINVEEIRSLVLAFPPPSEQLQISTHLLDQTKQFDHLISEAVLSIELLRERRTALISAAVTGQIDVREFTSKMATK